MRTVLITGGEGALAQYVKESLKENRILAPGKKEFDVTNRNLLNIFFDKNRPNVIVHLAAKTNVDECEKNPEDAFQINSEGTKNVTEICKVYGSFLIYISTAAVFDGKKNIFYEDDRTNPVNIYGKSKLLGENYIRELLDNYLIIRAAWLIGGGKKEKKFISYIVDQVNEGVKEIKAVNDKFGTLTYAKELGDLIRDLIDEDQRGVFHFGSIGVCTRFDIAKQILANINSNIKLTAVSSGYFSQNFSAPRPDREVIGSKKIEFSYSWQESLENYLKNEIIPEYGL